MTRPSPMSRSGIGIDSSTKLLFAMTTQRTGRRKRTGAASQPEELRLLVDGSEEMFRLLVESVKDYAIFMLDPTGHIASWNLGAERIKQYRADEIIGKHFSIFYTPEDLAGKKPE